jgi:hypothetical protein
MQIFETIFKALHYMILMQKKNTIFYFREGETVGPNINETFGN